MEPKLNWHDARALLEWQIEMGVNENILDSPLDRYALEPSPIKTEQRDTAISVMVPKVDPVVSAQEMSKHATSLDELRAIIGSFEYCELKLGARNLVFSDGNPKASVMIVGEAPGREEDQIGKPFVGRAGRMLDRMFAAIALDRFSQDYTKSIYITNVLPWRPPQNRDPKPEEISMMFPFLKKHISLINPKVVVAMGNIACQALLSEKGISKLRGNFLQRDNRIILPMFHPAYLLRNPSAKKHAWADLLSLKKRIG